MDFQYPMISDSSPLKGSLKNVLHFPLRDAVTENEYDDNQNTPSACEHDHV
jgi:hypothetical protein